MSRTMAESYWQEMLDKALQYKKSKGPLFQVKELFVYLYVDIKKKLLTASKKSREEMLLNLKEGLIQKLSLEESQLQGFSGDFTVYSYFIRVRITDKREHLPAIAIDKLWEGEEHPESRYQELVVYLLRPLVDELKQRAYLTLSAVEEHLQVFEALSRLSLEKREKEAKPSIRETLCEFLLLIIRKFRDLVLRRADLRKADCLKVCDWQWRLLRQFNLEAGEEYQAALRNIQDCYQEVAQDKLKQEFFYKEQKETSIGQRFKGLLAQVDDDFEIEHLVINLTGDLRSLERWSEIYALGKLLISVKSKQESYLEAYREVEEKFGDLSRGAFKIRMKYEEKWRNKSATKYIGLLNKLDDELIKFQGEIVKRIGFWRDKVAERFSEEGLYLEANKIIAELESKEVQRLQYFDWVYHTAYCSPNTEHKLAHEMQARERLREKPRMPRFIKYDLKNTITLSDFAVGKLPEIERGLRSIYLKVHPDVAAAQGDVAKQELCTWCSKELEKQKAFAVKINEQWRRSQWSNESIALPFIPIEELTEAREVTSILRPKKDLNLMVLVLKKEFLGETEGINSMHKKANTHAAICQEFDDAREDEVESRLVTDSDKRIIAKTEWELKEAKREKEVISREKEVISREKEVISREKEVISREKEVISRENEVISREKDILNDNMNESIRNLAMQELSKRFIGVAISGESWVRKEIKQVVDILQGVFRYETRDRLEGIVFGLIKADDRFSGIRRFVEVVVEPQDKTQQSRALSAHGTFANNTQQEDLCAKKQPKLPKT